MRKDESEVLPTYESLVKETNELTNAVQALLAHRYTMVDTAGRKETNKSWKTACEYARSILDKFGK